MVKDHLLEPFELVLKEYMDVCPRGRHSHTFFELIYIVSGTGTQWINELKIPYENGQLFIVAPNDNHIFYIDTTTQFFFIRFNNAFLKASKRDEDLLEQLEMIFQNSRNEPECILKSKVDRQFVDRLMEMIIAEHLNNGLFHQKLILQLVNTVLIVVARNISNGYPEKIIETAEVKALEILQYIQSNIYYPEKLRIDAISTSLHISVHYLGRYFRKHTNEALQQYIINYKIKLIENRLLRSNMRISEIADEFGFTDKSHLSRTFKKYKGISPVAFKNKSH